MCEVSQDNDDHSEGVWTTGPGNGSLTTKRMIARALGGIYCAMIPTVPRFDFWISVVQTMGFAMKLYP